MRRVCRQNDENFRAALFTVSLFQPMLRYGRGETTPFLGEPRVRLRDFSDFSQQPAARKPEHETRVAQIGGNV